MDNNTGTVTMVVLQADKAKGKPKSKAYTKKPVEDDNEDECDCYCCEMEGISEEEDAYLSSYRYLVPFEQTPASAFKACRDAFVLVSQTIDQYKLADRQPEWLEQFEACIPMAEDNGYYPELNFGTQTVCWLGMRLAGGRLDCLTAHVEEWRVQPFGREMLRDILACTGSSTPSSNRR